MNRKAFLFSVSPFAGVVSVFDNKETEAEELLSKIPPYLQKGDTVGITSPAGYISFEDIQPCIVKLQEWGFDIKTGETIGERDFTFGGTDDSRSKDFQQMLDDRNIKAIMCARGGYGAIRILDRLNFDKFIKNPKWIIGFSDATVFHSHISKNFGIASIHAKMCNSFPTDWTNAEPIQIETIGSINKCLTGEKMCYTALSNNNNRLGMAEGVLVGGNLSTLENLAGTPSDINTEGKILFIEEVDEYLYSIDRMLWNLKRTAKFQKLKGLIIGGFNRIKQDDAGEEFGKTVYEMINEKVKNFNYPVCFDFPVGHQKNNFALKCGVKHRLQVRATGCKLEETGVQ